MKTLQVKVRERWYTVKVGDVKANPVNVVVDGDKVEVYLDEVSSVSSSGVDVEDINESTETAVNGVVPVVKTVITPMPGTIVSVTVKPGDRVKVGDQVCVLEAMKMQQSICSEWSGTVKAVHVNSGQQMSNEDPIIVIE